MLTTYIRSSSLGAFEFCQHKAYLSYVLGFEEDGNKKAELGNVLHKVGECLALAKLKHQETGQVGPHNIGDHYIGDLIVDDIFDNESVINKLCKLSHDYHASISKHDWTNKDLITAIEWANKVISFQGGEFDPRNKNVICVEKYFDFELEHDWAHYSYKIGDTIVEGQLALKGTIDLIMEIAPDHYEVLDYKTGKRINWATGEEKTYEKLQTDPQLLLYYYACRKVFPDIPHFDFTIYYINSGGPFTMSFDDRNIKMAEDMIREKFTEMKNLQEPKLISSTNRQRMSNFRCKSLCHFYKHNQPGTDIPICEFFQNKVKELGADEVMNQYGNMDKISSYGDGGGKKSE